MSKTLIIAEKSTQMREYARALGFTLKGDHYEKGDTILSCAAGHLLELAEDTAYRGEGKWDKSYRDTSDFWPNSQRLLAIRYHLSNVK